MAFPRLHARFHPEIAVKFLLFPYLLAQGAWLRKAALVLPEPEGARAGVAGSGYRSVSTFAVGSTLDTWPPSHPI